ncbi:hypothetical protein ACFXGA_16965, partial [Actinosynnema sp. NPDC059335]|uniref:hypothetical protein n=1 Tax=Actinosynnema sp. NPDC059335 TaxID=3346804 RepID=UPI00366DD1BA
MPKLEPKLRMHLDLELPPWTRTRGVTAVGSRIEPWAHPQAGSWAWTRPPSPVESWLAAIPEVRLVLEGASAVAPAVEPWRGSAAAPAIEPWREPATGPWPELWPGSAAVAPAVEPWRGSGVERAAWPVVEPWRESTVELRLGLAASPVVPEVESWRAADARPVAGAGPGRGAPARVGRPEVAAPARPGGAAAPGAPGRVG